MDQVKTSVETIFSYVKNPNNKKNLAREIFIDVGVITDIDPTGAEKLLHGALEGKMDSDKERMMLLEHNNILLIKELFSHG
jgi:hypothetical protein